ncbi:MAG: hypothetical protein M1840_004650 [Geoglossum simile]|nr:MAG: hypothetical protein M1840_004650 [Geoglossum simile]
MGPRKNLLASRRRVEDDGEEEGGPGTVELEDDSMTETSVHSEEDDDDMDGSDTSEVVGEDVNGIEAATTNGRVKAVNGTGPKVSPALHDPLTCVGGDTEAMMNGLRISGDQLAAEEIDFEDMTEDMGASSQSVQGQPEALNETPFEKRRREHEEYKKRRDADPAFVPNRGAFFMHDHRHAGPAANGFRPFGRGRGRGKGGAIGGPYSPANQMEHSSEATQAPWAHDMHEAVAQVDPRPQPPLTLENPVPNNPRNIPFAPKSQPPNRSLSKTTHIGNVQIRVLMAGMPDPIIFSGVPVKQYTRLPHHRPPLRRDKPVRISLPDQPIRYIYPAPDRSFIFIPRAQRPNQQGFGRGRGKPSFGVYSGYGSRRTSAYGGSNYSPSVAMSRRSSLAHELHRDNVMSPTGSTTSRHYGLPADSGKPVVKLPPSISGRPQPPLQDAANVDQQGIMAIPAGPAPKLHYNQSYPPPQKPTYRENRPAQIPMHQPRPQKTVSVADIESPAGHSFPIPHPKQQPFHQQVPSQPNGHAYPQDPAVYNPHSRHPSYPGHTSTGTPLSRIPESAIHARPFQPVPYQHQQFYPQQALLPQAAYYYQIPDPRPPPYSAAIASAAVAAPVFVPSPQQSAYLVPVPAVNGPPATQPTGQGNTVAQESNGMVYYYHDSSQFYPGTAGAYPPAGYALPPQPGGVVGMGGMMTPSPDVYYYPQPGQGGTYYSQQ